MIVKEIDLSSIEVQGQIESLMYEHFNEVNSSEKKQLSIDWNGYSSLQSINRFVAVGAFVEDTLVGYCGLFVLSPMHYSKDTIGISDTIFLIKELRNSTLGLKLINKSKQLVKELGATEINWYVKPESSLEGIMKRRGKLRDLIYKEEV